MSIHPSAMEVQIIFFGFFLLLVNGARIQRDAEDECAQPPENTEGVRCCEMPKRHVWGKIRETVHFCAAKIREEGGEDPLPPPPPPPPLEGGGEFRRPHGFRPKFHNGCFVECMFEREGFIVNNVIQKEALMERIKESFEGFDEWKPTAEAAVEKCATGDIEVPANETCKSGAAEVSKCIFKEMFMQCPIWLNDNEYCTSLKEFYVRCPEGPPPEVFFKHHPPHHLRRHLPGRRPDQIDADEEPEPID